MTGAQIKSFFIKLIEGGSDQGCDLDDDFIYDLANNVKDQIEADKDWEILKAKDTSNTFNTSGDYTTEYDLPDGCLRVFEDGVWVGDYQWWPIPFEEQITYKDTSRRYFIDWKNHKIHFCGTHGSADAITIFHVAKTDDISAGSNIGWPSNWQKKIGKLIAFQMAELYFEGIDTDEVNRQMSPQQRFQKQMLMDTLISWDTKLKLNSMERSTARRNIDYSTNPNVVYH